MPDSFPSFYKLFLFTVLGWPFALAGLAYAEGLWGFMKNDKTGFRRIYGVLSVIFWWVAILGIVAVFIVAAAFWPLWNFFHKLGRSHSAHWKNTLEPTHQQGEPS